MNYVKLGTILTGAEPFRVGNVNNTFRGQVLLNDGQVISTIIKDLDSKQLANELMAAAMGLAAKLPIPIPIIAIVDNGVLDATRCPLADGTGHLVFASADMNTPNVQQIFIGDPSGVNLIMEKLANWADVGGMFGFDSWIANTDRHQGNLLFSGKNDIWLIDHGHSFTGPTWKAADFRPDAPYANRLSEWLTPFIADNRRKEIAGFAGAVPSRINGIEIGNLGEVNYVARLLVQADYEALVVFLNERMVHVPRLASKALGIEILI